MWLTVGGNDLALDPDVGGCYSAAGSDAEANACLKAASDRAMACTETMLGKLWEEFPDTKVGMYVEMRKEERAMARRAARG